MKSKSYYLLNASTSTLSLKHPPHWHIACPWSLLRSVTVTLPLSRPFPLPLPSTLSHLWVLLQDLSWCEFGSCGLWCKPCTHPKLCALATPGKLEMQMIPTHSPPYQVPESWGLLRDSPGRQPEMTGTAPTPVSQGATYCWQSPHTSLVYVLSSPFTKLLKHLCNSSPNILPTLLPWLHMSQKNKMPMGGGDACL